MVCRRWSKCAPLDDGKFKYETVYKAKIKLTLKDGYTVNDVTPNMFYMTGATLTNAQESLDILAEFSETPYRTITDITLNGIVEPKLNETSSIPSFISDQWTATMKWLDEEDNSFTGTFGDEKVYTAEITLEKKDGYSFMGIGANSFIVPGSVEVINEVGTKEMTTMKIKAIYNETGAIVPPSSPQNPNITYNAVTKDMTISWDEPLSDGGSAITSYEVYRWDGGKINIDGGIGIEASKRQFIISNVVDVGNYQFSINAVNVKGAGSNALTPIYRIVAKPNKVENLKAKRLINIDGNIESIIKLTWDKPDDNNSLITKYELYYTADEEISSGILANIDVNDKPNTSIYIEGENTLEKYLQNIPMNVYAFKIRAINEEGTGNWSDEAIINEKKVKVTYELNGGRVNNGNVQYVRYNYPYGKTNYPILDMTYGMLKVPEKDMSIFAGWYDTNTYVNKVTNETIVENQSNHSLYAKWLEPFNIEEIPNQKYTGAQIRPEITFKDGEVTLVKGEDYYLSYDNNIEIGTNTAIITVNGKGKYNGTLTKNFSIVKNSFDLDWSSLVTNDITYNKEYDGTDTVMFNNGGVIENSKVIKQIVDGKELSIIVTGKYSDKNAGDGKGITLSAKLSASDEAKYTISNPTCTKRTELVNLTGNIIKADITNESISTIANQMYNNGADIKPVVIVTVCGETLVKDVDYTLTYENNVTVGTEAKVIVTAKETSQNFKGSGERKFNIVKNSTVDIEIEDATFTYTTFPQYVEGRSVGKEGIELSYTYYGSNEDGTKNTLDVISDRNTIIDAGTYYVVASLNGDLYTALPKEAKFEIQPKEIKLEGITVNSKTYDGTNVASVNMDDVRFKLVTVGASDAITNSLNEEIDKETGYLELVKDGVTWTYENYNAGGNLNPREVTKHNSYGLKDKAGIPVDKVNKYKNYKLKQDNLSNLKGVINPIELEYSVTAKDKKYDGNDNAELTFTITNPEKIVINGVTGEKESVTITGQGKFVDKEVGESKTVNVTNVKTNNTNYVVNQTETNTQASISPSTKLKTPKAKLTDDSKPIKGDRYYKGIKVELYLDEVFEDYTDCEIWYALDDSEIYNKYDNAYPIVINSNKKIKAYTKKTGYLNSDTAEFEYLIRTADDVLIDIDYLPKSNYQKLKNILESNADDRALLEEKYSDLLSNNLYKPGNFTRDEIDNILKEVKEELDKIPENKKNKDFPEVLKIVLEMRRAEEIIKEIDEIFEEINNDEGVDEERLKENLGKLEDLIIQYEKLSKETKQRINAKTSSREKIEGYKTKYYDLLESKNYINKRSNIEIVGEEEKIEEVELIGLLTKIEKTNSNNTLELKVTKENVETIPTVLEDALSENNKVLLGYDIKAIEKDESNNESDASILSTKSVLLKVKIPDTLKDKEIKMYHIKDNGTLDEGNFYDNQHTEFYHDNAYIIFTTDSFSPFYLVETEIEKYKVTVNKTGQGIVSPQGDNMVEKNDDFKVRIIPNEGYKSVVTVNGITTEVLNNELYINNVIENITVNVEFKKISTGSGTGSGSGGSSGGGSGGGSGGSGGSSKQDDKNKKEDKDEKKDETQVVTNPDDNGNNSNNGNSKKMHSIYMYGYKDKTFRPTAYITRSEIAAMLSRIDNTYNVNEDYLEYISKYSDLNTSYWAANNIGFTTKNKTMIGYTDKTFRPQDYITRGEIASAIARYKGYDYSNKVSKFSDVKGRWFEKYVAVLEEKEIVVGKQYDKYDPDSYITRAEACAMINRIIERIPNSIKINILDNDINKFSDVQKNKWYYLDVIEATVSHPLSLYH